jgi:TonB-linked outer membrane protein, SusC/RagA family/TonB-dependent outer membrane receptor, SusC/RagA subfamily, signature region
MVMAVNAIAQTPVKGTVKDQNGQPVLGVGVLVLEDATKGVITSDDGTWALDVKKGNTLQFSAIGYKTLEVKVGDDGVINVTLEEDVNLLDDVVVIGYGTARKADLTGATSSVGGERLRQSSTPQVSTQLQGQMAGVQVTRSSGDPSAGSTIRVRGITTMSTNDPLVIIDGIPGNLGDVAAEEIKDIQVLKDAASAAIYGSRAAAGVILVTTKRANSTDFAMSYNFEFGIDKPTTVPHAANAVEWMSGFNEMRYNDGATSLWSGYSEEYINSYNENHLKDPDTYPDVDWMDLLKKTSTHKRHNFTLTGGTNKLKTNFSMSYFDSDGIVNKKSYDKLNARSSNDYYINEWIHASADINLVYSKSVSPHNGIGSYLYENCLMPAIWSDGEYAEGKDGDNPLALTDLSGQNTGQGYTVSGKLQLDITPLKGLTFTAVAAPKYYFYKGKDHQTKYKVRRINGDYIYSQTYTSTSVNEARNDNNALTLQFYGNYKLNLGRHSFSAMAGYEDFAYKWENESAWRSNYELDNYPYLNLGPADYQYNSGNAGHNAYRSVFGRIMYSFADRYLFQANIRTDGSSRFAKGYRWATFPSVSAGWVISEEPWFKNNVVSYLKLRGSVGQLGNERIGSEFPYQALLNFGTGFIPNASTGTADIVQTAYQSDYAFNDITWETTTTYGAGLDASFFDGRLRFNGDWYYKKTKDMLLTVGFPLYFGYNAPQNNAADMHTRG